MPYGEHAQDHRIREGYIICPNTRSNWEQQDSGAQELHPTRDTDPSSLGWCPQQTLSANSEASPTTPRGSSTPRHSNTPRIPGSQELGHTRISGSQNPEITGSQTQLDFEEFWHNQDYRKDRLQSDIARAGSTRDIQMVGGHKQQKPRLLGIIRTQFSHYSMCWIQHHTGKARFRSKITSHDDDREL